MSLPSGYKRLAYIESTGTQYIDTGFKPNQDTGFEAKFELLTDPGARTIFGARNSTSQRFELMSTDALNTLQDGYDSKTNAFASAVMIGVHEFSKLKNVTTLDGTEKTYTASTFQINYNFGLFTLNNAGVWDSRIPEMRLYSAKLYDNEVLIRDFIPCANKSDNVGLYDIVSGEFYGDAAGGSFVAGPLVDLPPPKNFAAVNTTIASIPLAWDAVDGALGYVLSKNGLQIADTPATEYTDNDVKAYHAYSYEVYAYNDEKGGVSATLKTSATPSDGISLIDYRTASDVARVNELRKKLIARTATEAERNEWLDGMIGAYNFVDMNRVEGAVEFIRDYLNGLQAALDAYRAERIVSDDAMWVVPWDAVDLVVKKEWMMEDIPVDGDLARYLSNVDIVTDALAIVKNLPESMVQLDYLGANEIERALIREHEAATAYETNAKQLIDNTHAAFLYSGEIYGGEV